MIVVDPGPTGVTVTTFPAITSDTTPDGDAETLYDPLYPVSEIESVCGEEDELANNSDVCEDVNGPSVAVDVGDGDGVGVGEGDAEPTVATRYAPVPYLS